MRTIKFRRRDGSTFSVDEDSIVQLVGCDINGREVYEGDKVISVADIKPFPTEATFDDFSGIRDEEIVLVPS